MFNFENQKTEINYITRNKEITVFYNRFSVFSFISALILYKYFQHHEMLGKVRFLSCHDDKTFERAIDDNYTVAKDGFILVVDTDVTYRNIIKLFNIPSQKIHIFDNKKSTESVINKISKTLLFKKNQDRVLYTKSTDPINSCISVMWNFIFKDNMPESLKFIDGLLQCSFNQINEPDNNFILSNIDVASFDKLYDFLSVLKKPTYDGDKFHNLITNTLTRLAINNLFKNSFVKQINGLKTICINCSKIEASFALPLSISSEVDISIAYNYNGHYYTYTVKTFNEKIDLLNLFRKLNPSGYSMHCWFTSKKFILQ